MCHDSMETPLKGDVYIKYILIFSILNINTYYIFTLPFKNVCLMFCKIMLTKAAFIW